MKRVPTWMIPGLVLPGALVFVGATAGVAGADHLPPPLSVSLPGSFNSEVGCAGDWDPACAAVQLSYNAGTDRWTGVFSIPVAGSYEYKVAINNSWDENYGIGGNQNGANIPLVLLDPGNVVFTYDPHTHVVVHSTGSSIVVAPGSFQSELGCPGDWDPTCLNSQLAGPGLDGLYTLSTTQLPPGCYEFKIAINLSWNENYGENGTPGGNNIPFCVPENNAEVVITYDPVTHVPTVTVSTPVPTTPRTWSAIKAAYR